LSFTHAITLNLKQPTMYFRFFPPACSFSANLSFSPVIMGSETSYPDTHKNTASKRFLKSDRRITAKMVNFKKNRKGRGKGSGS
jgi:hypothetical protein